MKAGRITVSRSKRGTTIKATGTAAQALFEALTKGTPRTLVHEPGAPTTPGYELVHKLSGKVHRTVPAGKDLVLDSWEERECSVRELPADHAKKGGA